MIHRENKAIWLSGLTSFCIAVVALLTARVASSDAILLDGLFNITYSVVSALTLRVAYLLHQPDNQRFPFGYMFFEPLINAMKGLLLLGVAAFAFYGAVTALLAGGRATQAGPGILYAVATTIVCCSVWLLLRNSPVRKTSPLINADTANWFVNAIISGGILISFCCAWIFERSGMVEAAGYVDPVVVIAIVLFSIGVPIRIAWNGIAELLHQAPSAADASSIDSAVEEALGELRRVATYVRSVRMGRTMNVSVHVVLDDAEGHFDVTRADALRHVVIAALTSEHEPVVVDVVFTQVDAFADPSRGYDAPTLANRS